MQLLLYLCQVYMVSPIQGFDVIVDRLGEPAPRALHGVGEGGLHVPTVGLQASPGLDLVPQLAGMMEQLLGDAAHVDAGPPQAPPSPMMRGWLHMIGQEHRGPQASQLLGTSNARRPPANDGHIVGDNGLCGSYWRGVCLVKPKVQQGSMSSSYTARNAKSANPNRPHQKTIGSNTKERERQREKGQEGRGGM